MFNAELWTKLDIDMIKSLNGKLFPCFLIMLFLFYSLFWYLNNPRTLVALVVFVSFAIIVVLGFCYLRDRDTLRNEWIFLAVLVLFSLIFCFLFPPFSVPDEGHHYFSTYWLVDSLPFNSRVAADGSFLVREADLNLYSKLSSNLISSSSFDSIFNHFSWFESSKYVSFSDLAFSIGTENVPAKIGSVIGLQIGLLLGLGAYPVFYLGRMGSIAVFCFCAFHAYKIAPKGKSVIVFVSLLPMTLHLTASYSYDSGIIALSLLVFAFLMRGFFGEDRSIGIRQIIAYFIISALLAPCKVIYCGLIVLAVFIPLDKFEDVNKGRLSKYLLIFVIAASVLVLRLASVSGLVSQSTSSSRGGEAGQFYSLNDILLHPRNSFMVFCRTLDSLGDFYWETTLGYSLGWFQENLRMPTFYMIPYLVCGFICCIDSQDEDAFLNQPLPAMFIGAFAVAALGSIASMWLGWTFNNESVIQGVQGRYFLPALPALLFGLRSRAIKYRGISATLVLLGICSMNCIYLIRFISVATCM